MFRVLECYLCIYELTDIISWERKLIGRNVHKKGQGKQSENSSQEEAKNKLKEMLQGKFVLPRVAQKGSTKLV